MTDAFDVLRLVAQATQLPPARICGPFQRHCDARARHLCWYLCHTVLGMRQADVGAWFDVDRRAIAYGISRVEDMRDDDAYDVFVTALERDVEDNKKRPQGKLRPFSKGTTPT